MEDQESLNRLQLEIERLVSNCNGKRRNLQNVIHKNTKKRQRYGIVAGVLSIISATLMSVIAVEIFPKNLIQFTSVFLAASGGVLALYASILHGENEVSAIHTGSSKFLSIREKANQIALYKNTSISDVLERYEELVREYVSISEIYDKYLPIDNLSYQTMESETGSEFSSPSRSYIRASDPGAWSSSQPITPATKSNRDDNA